MPSYAREDPGEFARLMGHWRRARGLSQEALGATIQLSQRHISFIENGRTRPSIAVVLRIIDALALTAADGNRLLNLLGYSAVLAPEKPDDPGIAPQDTFLAATAISGLEPLPASVIADQGQVRCMSLVQAMWWSEIAQAAEVFADDTLCYHRVVFHPSGMRRFVENWEEFVAAYLQIVLRDKLRNPEQGERMLREIRTLAPVPDSWLEMRVNGPDISDVILRRRTALGTVNLKYATFSIGQPRSHQAAFHGEMIVNYLQPVDERSAAIVHKLRRLAKPGEIHERLRPALSGKTTFSPQLQVRPDNPRSEITVRRDLHQTVPRSSMAHVPSKASSSSDALRMRSRRNH